MAKIPFQDVVPPERRSIRNIQIPNGDRKKRLPNLEIQEEPEQITPNPKAPERKLYEYSNPEERPQKSRKLIIIVIIVLILGFILLMMTVFTSSTILITPKSEKVPISLDIKVDSKTTSQNIGYEVMRLSQQKTVSIDATGEEVAEVKASGKIRIYNSFSEEPQRLIVRTRFETKDGLIYRIPESVMVPGKTAAGPGFIDAEIFADETGEKYNVNKNTTFTIPGFKSDTKRFDSFKAEAITNIEGGFVGKRKTINPNSKEIALKGIETELQTVLQKDISSKIPNGLVLLENAMIFESKELPQKEVSSSVIIGTEVSVYAIMINTDDLSKKIKDQYIAKSANWLNTETLISDFSKLKITNKPLNFEEGNEIDLSISGEVDVIGNIDSKDIVERLVGKPKGEASALINEFEGISSVAVTIRPLWKKSFPTNPSKIYVEVIGNK